MPTAGISTPDLLAVIAEGAQPGSLVAPWWLRIGVLVYGVLLVAALMIYAQSMHQRPWDVLWVLIIAFIPVLGAISYFIAQTVVYSRAGPKHTKGRAERLPPEDYSD